MRKSSSKCSAVVEKICRCPDSKNSEIKVRVSVVFV
jgi:hypothetical protein